MRRNYCSWDDVEAHMNELINARRPFKGIDKENRECIIIPLSITVNGQLKAAMILFSNGDQGNGDIAVCDCEDFQEMDWEPVELPDEEWKQYLP